MIDYTKDALKVIPTTEEEAAGKDPTLQVNVETGIGTLSNVPGVEDVKPWPTLEHLIGAINIWQQMNGYKPWLEKARIKLLKLGDKYDKDDSVREKYDDYITALCGEYYDRVENEGIEAGSRFLETWAKAGADLKKYKRH